MERSCVVCEVEFDTNSPEKRRAGGRLTHCPDCSEESTTKYLGLQSADGKTIGVTILKFENEQDREDYQRMWKSSTSSPRAGRCSTTVAAKFTKIHESGLGMNHKGKL